MNGRSTRTNLVGRRGELLVELFLQELGAEFITRPEADLDLGYDLFVGFKNPEGGINLTAVEVKATERPIDALYPVQRQIYQRLANTNIPVLLLVADVKQNRLFYALPGSDPMGAERDAEIVSIPLKEADETATRELRAHLAQSQVAASGSPH
jgi:hypothetical protein